MDRDYGSKPGSGGVLSSSQSNVDRRERLRRLALETIDLNKDPYFMKNHLGSYECKLCLTLHSNEGNYLAHTQGKRHKMNLARRMAKESGANPNMELSNANVDIIRKSAAALLPKRKTVKIGRPGYEVKKERVMGYPKHKRLIFRIFYPDIERNLQPRHRFMSSFEQKIDLPPSSAYQYILFAAEPYETIAFKIPNVPIDKSDEFNGGVKTKWDNDQKIFEIDVVFNGQRMATVPPPPRST
jgi:splicing factor 3A subunit 2